MFTTAVGVLATCTGLLRSWPQFARIVVRRDATGVSALTWLLSMDAFITWEAIGFAEHITPTKVFNGLGLLSTSAILFVLVRHSPLEWWRPVVHAVGALLLNLGVFFVLGSVGTSVLGVGISMFMFIPQAVVVVRQPGEGVSPMTWWLAGITALLWGSYGLMIHKYVLIAPNLVTLPAAGVILWRLRSVHAKRLRNLSNVDCRKVAFI